MIGIGIANTVGLKLSNKMNRPSDIDPSVFTLNYVSGCNLSIPDLLYYIGSSIRIKDIGYYLQNASSNPIALLENFPSKIEEIPFVDGGLIFDPSKSQRMRNDSFFGFPYKDAHKTGFTIIVKRKILTIPKSGITSVLHIANSWANLKAPVSIETYNHKAANHTICTLSLCQELPLTSEDVPELISWQTSKSYNGIPIPIDPETIYQDNTNVGLLCIGFLPNTEYLGMIFYGFLIFNRDLTEPEIQAAIKYYKLD